MFASILSSFVLFLVLYLVLLLLCLPFFLSSLLLLLSLFLLSSACPLVLCLSYCLPCLFLCHCGVCVFLFPLGLSAKREGAIPCVLSCPVAGLFPLSYYLDSTAGDEVFHACHIINWYVIMIKTISSIIEANKRKI